MIIKKKDRLRLTWSGPERNGQSTGSESSMPLWLRSSLPSSAVLLPCTREFTTLSRRVCVLYMCYMLSHRNAPRWFSGNPTTTTCWFNYHSNAPSFHYRSQSFRVSSPATRCYPSSCRMQCTGVRTLVVRSLRQTKKGEARRKPRSVHTIKQRHQ